MSARYRQLAAHVRSLPDDHLNDLLVDLPTDRFMALVDAALSHPVNPAGLRVRLVSAAPTEGWTVLAGTPPHLIGSGDRRHPPLGPPPRYQPVASMIGARRA